MSGFSSLFSRTSRKNIKSKIPEKDYEYYRNNITKYKEEVENKLKNDKDAQKVMEGWFNDIYNLEMRFKKNDITETHFKTKICALKYKYYNIIKEINKSIKLDGNPFFNFFNKCELTISSSYGGKTNKRKTNKKRKHTRRKKCKKM